ncbi:ATPase with role in protein import into the ER [Naganishia albida]|nr:ATPase with role in protein import into the ER [Naganishia albida]
MKVSAADKATGQTESTVITNEKGRLSEEEIDRMIKEAEEYADEGAEIKKKMDALDIFQNQVNSTESSVNEQEGLGGKLSSSDKKTMLAAVKDAKECMESNTDVSAEDLEERQAEFLETYGSHDEL